MIKKENREVEVHYTKKEIQQVEVEYCDLCGREIGKNGVEEGDFSVKMYGNDEIEFEVHPKYGFCKDCAKIMSRLVDLRLKPFIVERFEDPDKIPLAINECKKYIRDNHLDYDFVLDCPSDPTDVVACDEELIKKGKKK